MSRSPLRIGLIGLGKMGQNHLRVLSMLGSVELVFLHDADHGIADRARAAIGLPVIGELDDGLRAVDAVVISTPTATHAEIVRRSAQFVRNIFVEKPLAATLAESSSLLRFSEERDLRLQVGFIERFNSAVQMLKRVLDESKRVVSVDFTRTNKLSARVTDIDVVADLMIHDIDLALFLNGPVTDVVAHGVRTGDMVDFASAMLLHGNGRFSRIQASRITEKKMRTIRATCGDMFVDCELVRKEIVINRQSEIRHAEGEPFTVSAIEETVEVRPQEALLSELQAFVAFSGGEAVADVPTARDAVSAMDVCERIRAAIRR